MTAVTLSQTLFDAFLKEQYPQVRVDLEATRKAEFFRSVKKVDDWYGDAYVVPLLVDNPQGHSRTFANALSQAETSTQYKFVGTTRVKDYGSVSIGGEVMMAASKNVGSFVRARETQINGMLNQLGKRANIGLFRDTNGYIGIVSALGDSNKLITLTNKSDVYNFGFGMTVSAADGADGSTPRDNQKKIDRLDASAGTIHTVTAIGSIATGDYLFNYGDEALGFHGLASWLPLTAPSDGDSHFGVDRSDWVERLAGKRLDNSTRTILENATELAMLINEDGGEPDTLWMHPRAGKIFADELGVKVEREDGGAANVGYTGFKIQTFCTGPLTVRFDRDCQPGLAYMLQSDTWRLAHMGPIPHIYMDDGQEATRSTTADAITVVARGYFGDLFCEAPGFNGVMSVATLA
jgi:hypothetical protein